MSQSDPPNPPAGQLLIYQDGGMRLQVRLGGLSDSKIALVEEATAQ